MLNAKQIRAARALLDWTQETLAEKSGVARATIKNVESENTLPRLDTSNALQRTLEGGGVEFLPGSGVRLKDSVISIYEGKDANRRIAEDIYQTLRDTGGDLYLAHANEEVAIEDMGRAFLEDHIRKREELNIRQHILVRARDKGLIPPFDKYRIIPDEYFTDSLLAIYGQKLALVIQAEPQKTVIINDARISDGVGKLFKFIWDRTEMPSYKGRT